MVESASTADITFWLIHPAIERCSNYLILNNLNNITLFWIQFIFNVLSIQKKITDRVFMFRNSLCVLCQLGYYVGFYSEVNFSIFIKIGVTVIITYFYCFNYQQSI